MDTSALKAIIQSNPSDRTLENPRHNVRRLLADHRHGQAGHGQRDGDSYSRSSLKKHTPSYSGNPEETEVRHGGF
jgi:hypothetical protein